MTAAWRFFRLFSVSFANNEAMDTIKNSENYEDSKERDKLLIDQVHPYFCDMVKPFGMSQLGGRDADMLYVFHGLQVVTDFKMPSEVQHRDNWYYAYREICLRGGVVLIVVLKERKQIQSVSQIKVIGTNIETVWMPCNFLEYLDINRYVIEKAAKLSYNKDRIFKPHIMTMEKFNKFRYDNNIGTYKGIIYP